MRPSIQEIIDLLAENKEKIEEADDACIRQIHISVQEALFDAEMNARFFGPNIPFDPVDELEKMLSLPVLEEPEDDLLERLFHTPKPDSPEKHVDF